LTLIEAKQQEIIQARRVEEAKAKAAEKTKKEKEEKAAADAHMSEAGAIFLVELAFKYSGRLSNYTSDKVEDVWKHIHKDFTAAVQNGDLPETDLREVGALHSR
jgi:ribosomal protein L9